MVPSDVSMATGPDAVGSSPYGDRRLTFPNVAPRSRSRDLCMKIKHFLILIPSEQEVGNDIEMMIVHADLISS